jgi:serine protease
VRVRDKSGSAAAKDVEATVYWSEVATLITPRDWNLIGSTVVPNVPGTNVLTVSPKAIVWQAGEVPHPGHYCFVGLVGTVSDPAPDPSTIADWASFEGYIRENNNVAWRNFGVVDVVSPLRGPGVPKGFVELPFLAPGAWYEDLDMRLEVGAEVFLDVPLEMLERMAEKPEVAEVDKERQMARLWIDPHHRQDLGWIFFPAELRAALRLLARVPEEYWEGEFELFARQVWHDLEVGRVTWRLKSLEQEEMTTYGQSREE